MIQQCCRLSFPKNFASLGERIIIKLSRLVNYVGMTVLGLLIVFVAADVIGRYVFNRPIKGDFELVVLATSIIASLGLADALFHDGHIRIDIVTLRFPRTVRLVLDVLAYFLGLTLWAFIAWRITLYGITLKDSESISGMLPIPVFPFVFIVALGSVVLCFVFLIKLIHSVVGVIKK